MDESVKLDRYTSFNIRIMKKRFGPKNKIVITLPDKIETLKYSSYSKESLEEYYQDRTFEITETQLKNFNVSLVKPEISLLIVTGGVKRRAYFILDKTHKLIFVPVANREKNITGYAFTNLHNLIKLGGHTYCRTGKYIDSQEGLIHEIIVGRKAPLGFRVDHINCDPLDNRDENLRIITNEENGMNISEREDTYRGVYKSGFSWRVVITKRHLGTYNNCEYAAKIWDIAAAYLYPRIVYYDNETLTDEEFKHIENPTNREMYEDLLTIKKIERKLPKFISLSKNGALYFSKKYTKRFNDEEGCKIFIHALKTRFPEIAALKKVKPQKVTECCREWNVFNVAMTKKSTNKEMIEELAVDVVEFLKELEENERERLESLIDDYRIDGIACIDVYDGTTETIKKCKVDDEDWVIYIHYQWYESEGYPRTSELGMLHIDAIQRHFPEEYANKKFGESIDHSTNPYDARKEKLRIVGRDVQAVNTEQHRKSLCAAGVYIVGTQFKVIFKGIRYPERYNTEEEAARKYKELAEAAGSEKVRDVPNTKTTVVDKFGIKNLPNIIESVEIISELKTIVSINGLRKVIGCEITKHNFKECKEKIITYLRV